MNVFVLSTGRSGSTTFVAACSHARNYSAGHETRTAFLGAERFRYPDNHIESDNRLAWLLGRLDQAYGDRAFYVHLTRDREATATSYNRRWHLPVGIVPAYAESVLMGNRDRGLDSCRDYCDTVNANIAAFLRDKTRQLTLSLETIESGFPLFWERIGAQGDLSAALAEWRVQHNATGANRLPEILDEASLRARYASEPRDPERLSALVHHLLDRSAVEDATALIQPLIVADDLDRADAGYRQTIERLAAEVLPRAARKALEGGDYGAARELLERLDRLTRARAFLPMVDGGAEPATADRPTGAAGGPGSVGGTSDAAAESSRLRAIGDQALQSGRASEAADAYRRSLALDAHQPRVLNNLGIILSRKDWSSALPYFESSFRLDPSTPGIQGNLAVALAEAGRLDPAVQLATRPGSLVPYPLANNIISRLTRNPRYLQRPEVSAALLQLDQLAGIIGFEPSAERWGLSFVANFLHPAVPWREAALSRLSNEEMKQWVQEDGIDRLRALRQSGTGAVLVLSHLAAERVSTLVLARMGFRLNSLEFRNRLGDHRIRGLEGVTFWELQESEPFPLKALYLAKQAVQRGELFQLAGDGYRGGSVVDRTFLGRARPFRSGFAELALAAGVQALPVFCTLDAGGRIHLQVQAPLDPGAEARPHRERVASLVGDYARRLEQYWREHPENLVWDHLRRYLELPASSPEGAASDGAGAI